VCSGVNAWASIFILRNYKYPLPHTHTHTHIDDASHELTDSLTTQIHFMLESYFTRAPEISAKMQQKKQKQALADMHKAHTHTVEKNSEFSEAASSLAMFFK
jgi:hypothetical protein